MRIAIVAALAALWPAAALAVVGGREEPEGPARRSVMVLDSRGGVCSAVVVARDAVLTAAHCVAGAPEHRVHFRDAAGAPVLIEPAARAVHPGYEPRAIRERRRSIDLALVRLPEPLPARFEPALLSAAPVPRDAPVTLGGWGVAREGDARSSGTFRTAALIAVEPHGPSRVLLWAKGASAGACGGDSGGPLLDGERVAAITAFAAGEDRRGCGGLTQGVLVGPQRAWIDRVLGGWGRQARWD